MRQNIKFLLIIIFIFLLPSPSSAQKTELYPRVYYSFPSVGFAGFGDNFKQALMVSGVHVTIFERGRVNFLGFGVSYNWIKNPRYLRRGDFKESTALTIPFSFRLDKKENDSPIYLTLSGVYNMETSVRGYGFFAGFSVGNR